MRQHPPKTRTRKLQQLLARRQAALAKFKANDDALALAVLAVREADEASVRGLAETLGVGASTIQDWSKRGRELQRDGDSANSAKSVSKSRV